MNKNQRQISSEHHFSPMDFVVLHLFLLILSIVQIRSSLINTTAGLHIQIFDNIAEISQPISPFDLPKIFSQEEWSDIRSDSFRLIGQYVNVQAQIISFNRPTLDGQKILIQRRANIDNFTEAIMIDSTRNFIQDLVDQTFYTISSDRIRYLSPPPSRNYSVEFVFDTSHVEQLFLRYLQKNIKWRVQYDLILGDNQTNSFLQAYANIRNDGSSSLIIDSAQLMTGDVNIRSQSSSAAFDESGYGSGPVRYEQPINGSPQFMGAIRPAPSISSGEELAGVYVFSINEPFLLDSRSEHILPIFRPTIDVERYGIIYSNFVRRNTRGNAKRAYRLRVPEHYLPKGQVFIRESDRLVGEMTWSDRSANETNEFSLGEDPDLQYIETVQFVDRRQAYEANGYRLILSTYNIQVRLINNKNRSINFEYRLQFPLQENLTLKENTSNNLLDIDGASIIGVISIDANSEKTIEFTVETQ